ncbi:TetR/AcrR family transcriptional regulator [Bordetella genomosp. 1]|uniref:TetR family transcriptional regulator n=1 Tax=Bordetella genomosp. 1 TaxID=1395607 RepID=A0ABX4ETR1_9BORD|nr:TetR/AcrR family transcriptional regulator [Bordetella genomosp. 1]OZI57153.1 TetR family transcriptional regulator [Bordetella genomosp. 1]
MDTHSRLLAAAEQLFDRHGFTPTGMDRLAQAADISSRTLYKHAGSKNALIAAVLTARNQRFMTRIEVDRVDALFAALEAWMRKEGSRGCLLLRAQGETGGDTPEIARVVAAYKAELATRIRQIVASERGTDDPALAEQMLVLFEGATAAAMYRGVAAVAAARAAAAVLMDRAGR